MIEKSSPKTDQPHDGEGPWSPRLGVIQPLRCFWCPPPSLGAVSRQDVEARNHLELVWEERGTRLWPGHLGSSLLCHLTVMGPEPVLSSL